MIKSTIDTGFGVVINDDNTFENKWYEVDLYDFFN